MRELPKRILSALVFGPIMLVGFYFGGYLLFILTMLIAVEILREFARVKSAYFSKWQFFIVFMVSILWLWATTIEYPLMLQLLLASLIIIFLVELGRNLIEDTFQRAGAMLFLYVLCGILPSAFIQVRQFGKFWAILPIVMVWVVDTFAYWGGSLTGKHKLAQSISPKKTVEGFLWGIVSAIIIAIIVKQIYPEKNSLCIWSLVVITGIIGQLGDLFESKIKRQFGVKDMSSIMPGHGGIWDRMDSLFWVYPITLVMLNLLA
ncbi:hypothetical protein DRQ33_07015 [bacterium]|mgnify:CR=1 FL=1|nr:MAG: hypothetical protein DRQ33_07015 [bacterium]